MKPTDNNPGHGRDRWAWYDSLWTEVERRRPEPGLSMSHAEPRPSTPSPASPRTILGVGICLGVDHERTQSIHGRKKVYGRVQAVIPTPYDADSDPARAQSRRIEGRVSPANSVSWTESVTSTKSWIGARISQIGPMAIPMLYDRSIGQRPRRQ